MLTLLFIAFGVTVYYWPTFIADKKKHFWTILLVNTLFGWTILGWFVCLYLSITGPDKPKYKSKRLIKNK